MSNISVTVTKLNYATVTPYSASLPADKLTVEAINSSRSRVIYLDGGVSTVYEVSSSKAAVDALIATALSDTTASPYGAATGTDTYVVTISPSPGPYAAGQSLLVSFANTNTGAATLNVNGLGAKAIKKDISTAIAAGDIVAGRVYELRYDGTNFQLNEVATPAYVVTAGADTMTATAIPAPTSYVAGMAYDVKIGVTNTGAATINLNGLGAKAVKKSPAVALVAGDLVANSIYRMVYDGTNFQVVTTDNRYGAATGTDTYAVALNYPAAYTTGLPFQVLFGITNTGAATLNVNGLGAKALKKGVGGATALSASDLVITKIYTAVYDGTNIQLDL